MPCTKAPPDWYCALDGAVAAMHQAVLDAYSCSSLSVLTKTIYDQEAQSARLNHQEPRPYTGQFPPPAKFVGGQAAPLVMYARNREDPTEEMWPNNGTPFQPVWLAEFTDFFGHTWYNLYVYKSD